MSAHDTGKREPNIERYDDAAERQWVRTALARAAEQGSIDVDGVKIAFRSWGRGSAGQDPIVLLHGNAARGEWWDAVAPALAFERQVIAIDLSGHGRSGRLPQYGLDHWAREVVGVVDHLGARRATLVGHSMGGLVALLCAWTEPSRVHQVILIDTPFRRFAPDQVAKRAAIALRGLRLYGALPEAIAEFRTVPPLESPPPELVGHVAERSYRNDGRGWILHFDPAIYGRVTNVDDFLRPFPTGTVLLRAERGLVTPKMLDEVVPWMSDPHDVIEISGVGHNVILEAPLTVGHSIASLIPR